MKGWDYEIAGSYDGNRQVYDYVSGWVSEELFGPLLRSGAINPFGRNTPEALVRLQGTQVTQQAYDNRASHYGGDLKINGTPWELASGPVAVALGLEGRREILDARTSQYLATNDIVGGSSLGALPTFEPLKRNVWSVFGEVNLPLARSLEANVAVRLDHYSDFGGTTNPKLTVRWQADKSVALRGSWGTGFRAQSPSGLLFRRGVTGSQVCG